MSRLQVELVGRVLDGMQRLGLSQMQLAARSGVPQGNLSKILRLQRNCTVDSWNSLLEVVEPVSECEKSMITARDICPQCSHLWDQHAEPVPAPVGDITGRHYASTNLHPHRGRDRRPLKPGVELDNCLPELSILRFRRCPVARCTLCTAVL